MIGILEASISLGDTRTLLVARRHDMLIEVPVLMALVSISLGDTHADRDPLEVSISLGDTRTLLVARRHDIHAD